MNSIIWQFVHYIVEIFFFFILSHVVRVHQFHHSPLLLLTGMQVVSGDLQNTVVRAPPGAPDEAFSPYSWLSEMPNPFNCPKLWLLTYDTEGDIQNNPLQYISTSIQRTDLARILQILKETLCPLCFLPQELCEEMFPFRFKWHFTRAPSHAETCMEG